MKYSKILEVHEDSERVYFSFFTPLREQKIICLPKKNCTNNCIYAGSAFSELYLVDADKAKTILTNAMKIALMNHPSYQFCQEKILTLDKFI